MEIGFGVLDASVDASWLDCSELASGDVIVVNGQGYMIEPQLDDVIGGEITELEAIELVVGDSLVFHNASKRFPGVDFKVGDRLLIHDRVCTVENVYKDRLYVQAKSFYNSPADKIVSLKKLDDCLPITKSIADITAALKASGCDVTVKGSTTLYVHQRPDSKKPIALDAVLKSGKTWSRKEVPVGSVPVQVIHSHSEHKVTAEEGTANKVELVFNYEPASAFVWAVDKNGVNSLPKIAIAIDKNIMTLSGPLVAGQTLVIQARN